VAKGQTHDTLKTGPRAVEGPPGEVGPLLVRLLCADDLRRPSIRYRLGGRSEVWIFRSRSGGLLEPGDALAIAVDDPYASSRHLRLVRERQCWVALDEGSTNGTFVDGRRLADGERRPLGESALLELGHTFFLFRAAARGLPGPEVVDAGSPERREPATLNPEWEVELAKFERLSRTRHEVLIEGESGAGKEVLARLLHERSGRRGPLVSLNCAALSETLLDDEIFGHVRGAFSGAQADRQGLLRAADGGTLFLDEVGDMPAALQAKLLRVLEDGKVRPIGGETETQVDVRVVAATHSDLRALVGEGRFRHDLLGRLGLLAVRVPPVRERREDLGLLVQGVLGAVEGGLGRIRFDLEALRLVLLHPWPLNVRELRRALLAAVDLARADGEGAIAIGPQHLPPAVRELAPAARPDARPRPELTPAQLELRERIADLLRRHAGNVAAVARELGKPRTHVQRQMERLGIDRLEALGRDAGRPPGDEG
jgi:transcriptional regulator with AAA-type ATPase domain